MHAQFNKQTHKHTSTHTHRADMHARTQCLSLLPVSTSVSPRDSTKGTREKTSGEACAMRVKPAIAHACQPYPDHASLPICFDRCCHCAEKHDQVRKREDCGSLSCYVVVHKSGVFHERDSVEGVHSATVGSRVLRKQGVPVAGADSQKISTATAVVERATRQESRHSFGGTTLRSKAHHRTDMTRARFLLPVKTQIVGFLQSGRE